MKMSDEEINIEAYLEELKQLINQDWFEVDLERRKNEIFMKKYGLRSGDVKRILLGLKPEEFIERVKTENIKYNSKYLYIFKRNLILDDIENEDDESENEVEVRVYIKTSLPEGNAYKIIVVVSFHEDEE